MSLFKTDPLLACCRLFAWFFLLWVAGGCLFTACAAIATLVNGDFVVGALRMSYPQLQDDGLRTAFTAAMALIAVGLVVLGTFLRHILAIIRSVAAGEAFTLGNAGRIRALAWLSLIGMPMGVAIATGLSATVERLGPRAPDAGLRIEPFDPDLGYSQLLLTLLLFVLARLFAQAAAMRDEIEGTI